MAQPDKLDRISTKRVKLMITFACTLILYAAFLSGVSLYVSAQDLKKATFSQVSDAASHTVFEHLDDYTTLLYSGIALLEAKPDATQEDWATYFTTLNALTRYPGTSTISYVKVAYPGDETYLQGRFKELPDYTGSTQFTGVPDDGEMHGYLTMYVAGYSLASAIGFDGINSTPDRQTLYRAAAASASPVSSSTLTFATGREGFIVALPHAENGVLQGYVVVSFQNSEVFANLLNNKSIMLAYQVSDTTNETTLYTSDNWDSRDEQFVRSVTVDLGQRTLKLTIHPEASQNNLSDFIPSAIAISCGVIAAAILWAAGYRHIKRVQQSPPQADQQKPLQ